MSSTSPNKQSSTSLEDHDRKDFEIKKNDLRNQFNMLVFNTTFSPQEDKKEVIPVVSKNVKLRNEEKINYIIKSLQYWDEQGTNIRQLKKNGYDWVDRYALYHRTVNGEIIPYLEATKPKTAREVVPEKIKTRRNENKSKL